MTDRMEKIGHSIIQHGEENNRVYLMKLDKQDAGTIISHMERLAEDNGYEKIFCKVPEWAKNVFIRHHYEERASIPRFYQGKETVCFMTKFLHPERMHLTGEDRKTIQTNIRLARDRAGSAAEPVIPSGHDILKLTESHIPALAALYQLVYASYPFPITEPAYLRQTMMSGHVDYFGVLSGRELIAAASAEKDVPSANAEMTDFATIPEQRGRGLATALLVSMEEDMKKQGMATLYTIARAMSAGMNITFARCGYLFAGTLINNTQIFGRIESMNVWYKNII